MWDVKNKVDYTEIIEDFRCKEASEGTCIRMFFKNDKLSNMYLFQNGHLSFNKVVDGIGNPDGFNTLKLTPETKGCTKFCFGVKQRLRLTYSEGWFTWYSEPFRNDLCEKVKNAGNKIPNGLRVGIVEIMDEDVMEFLSQGLQPWNGFVDEP